MKPGLEAWQRLVAEAASGGAIAVCHIEIVTLDRWPDLLLDPDPASARIVALIMHFLLHQASPESVCLTCDGPPGRLAPSPWSSRAVMTRRSAP